MSGSAATVQARRPITGPSVWYAEDMRGRQAEWSYRLSPTQIAELEAALRGVQQRGLDIADIRRDDFPLPTLGSGARAAARRGAGRPRLRAAARRACRGPADRGKRDALLGHRRVFRQRTIAERERPSARPCLRPRRQQRDRSECAQLRDRRTAELPHRSLRRRRAAVPAACEVGRVVGDRQFDGGAQCRWLERRPDLLERLYQPFPVDRRGEVPEGKAPFYEAPVFNEHAGALSVLYSRAAYRLVAALPRGAPADAGGYRGARHAGRAGRTIRIAARHGRSCRATSSSCTTTPSCTPAPATRTGRKLERKRHLLRLWLAPPDARELPPVFAECYGGITPGDRGGIICKGTRLHAPLTPG